MTEDLFENAFEVSFHELKKSCMCVNGVVYCTSICLLYFALICDCRQHLTKYTIHVLLSNLSECFIYIINVPPHKPEIMGMHKNELALCVAYLLGISSYMRIWCYSFNV